MQAAGRDRSGLRALVGMTAAVLLLAGGATPVAAADPLPLVVQVGAGVTSLPGGGPQTRVVGTRLVPGIWSITASGTFDNLGSAMHVVKCRLVRNGIADLTFTPVWPDSATAVQFTSVLSHLVHVVTDPNGALVRWRCGTIDAADDEVRARGAGITATKLSRLTDMDLDSNVATETGTGMPRAISGHLECSIGAGGKGAPTDIASIDLPRGSWLVSQRLS